MPGVADPRCPKPARMEDFVTDRCTQRSRVAALRDGIDAAPVKLYSRTPELPPNAREVQRHGSLPDSKEEAVSIINSLRPVDSEKKLTADDVYIHYMEAGNNNFIGDRWMFLGRKTLQNTAKAAQAGFSFMNSHRTGGLSSPSELPFGRTFAGVYEHWKMQDSAGKDSEYRRSVLGVYMLRNQYPNGTGGPSTDAIHEGIEAGTIFDVSLGYSQDPYYQYICDVCGMDMDETEFDEKGDPVYCRHIPGTHYKMKQEEIDAQLERGVPKGYASYTLENATPGEVSAVYNGAVPGAGFRKALVFARAGKLSEADLSEVRESYGNLAGKDGFRRRRGQVFTGDLDWKQLFREVVESGAIPGLTFREDDPIPEPTIEKEGPPVPQATSTPPADQPTERERELAAKVAKLEADNEAARQREEQYRQQQEQFRVNSVVKTSKKMAREFAVKVCGGDPEHNAKIPTEQFNRVQRLHFALSRIDQLSPVIEADGDGNESTYEMVPDFEKIILASAGNSVFRERVFSSKDGKRLPGDLNVLDNHAGDELSTDDVRAEARKHAKELAEKINTGKIKMGNVLE